MRTLSLNSMAATTSSLVVVVLLMVMFSSFSYGYVGQRTMLHRLSGSSNYLTTEEHWFNQTLDHFSPYDHTTFQQRYYEFLDHFRAPDGPIFLKICGESSCDGIPNDYISVLAKKFGAAVVTLEHRYYGKSSPFKSLKTENLRFLSSKQALFDLAIFRQRYQIGVSAGPECKAALQEITQLVEKQLESTESDRKAIKSLFGASELDIDGDFMYLLADAAVTAFQYGNPDVLCSPLVQAKKAGEDLVDAYAKYVRDYYPDSVATYNQENLKSTNLDAESSGARLWWFQVCTEVAYFQVAPANDSIRSSKVDTRYHLDLCKHVFGKDIYPDVDVTNIYYGGTKIAGSKIVFTNGSQDPWRHASKQISSPDMPSYIISCHNCGHGTDLRGCPQSPLSPEGNAQNCSSPGAVNKVRQQIVDHIDLWLSECQATGRSYM
ncbi:serine protease EDA2 isoform X1 [Tripterygium wilfordii]|uniref:Serine protease EDA2 isoform X1 n=1 Tax=Tripterygium wilfordii TaxID=458696 RepID=A0A7J7E346_TRIWF|nr:serine protease EDA2 isoform X1 [Tripterygium wilfordii]